jgi:uncharacterized protein (TIGR02246 family)
MSTEIDQIVARVDAAYSEAYSAADPARLGNMFAEDATVQTEWGPILSGRDAITRGLVALFADQVTPNVLVSTPLQSREVAAGIIVSHGTAVRNAPSGPEHRFLYTRVYVQRDGDWFLGANHSSRPNEHNRPSGIGD